MAKCRFECILLLAVAFASSDKTIEIHRLIQYESRTLGPVGSWKVGITRPVAVVEPSDGNLVIEKFSEEELVALKRHFVLANFEELTVSALSQLWEVMNGLLLIVPIEASDMIDHNQTKNALTRDIMNAIQDPLTKDDAERLRAVERFLTSQVTNEVVYFARDDETIRSLFNRIRESREALKAASYWQRAVSSREIVKIKGSEAARSSVYDTLNVVGWLRGANDGVVSAPVILITSHYDSAGAAPSLASATDASASGAIALIEIARLLSNFYSQSSSRPQFDVCFLLSGGGVFEYHGIEAFVTKARPAELDAMEFALILDGIAADQASNLRFYVPPERGEHASIKAALTTLGHYSAVEFGTELETRTATIADESPFWPHAKFSGPKIPAITLSHRTEETEEDYLRRASLFDRDISIDAAKRIARVVRVLANGLASRVMQETNTPPVLQNQTFLDLDEDAMLMRIHRWQKHFADSNRFLPYTTQKQQGAFVDRIVEDLNSILSAAKIEVVTSPTAWRRYYVDNPPVKKAAFIQTMPLFVDFIHTLVNVTVMTFLYCVFKYLKFRTKMTFEDPRRRD